MSDHLSQEQIARYRQRLSPAAELIHVDRHMAECDECRERLARECGVATAGETQHLSYEQLEAYVDDQLPPEQRAAVLAHTRGCRRCEEELRDLERFRVELGGSARPRRGFRPFPSRRPFRSRGPFSSPGLAAAAAAVLVVLGVLIWHAPQRRPAAGAREVDRASPLREDAALLVRETGALTPSTRQAVLDALRTATLALPAILPELRGGRETLRGATDSSDGLAVLEPQAEVVLDPQPSFQWRPVAGATSYSVAGFDLDSRPVQSSPSLQDAQWNPPSALERGRTYQWQVTARMSDGSRRAWPIPPAPQARFAVASQSTADELELFRRENPDQHLVVGILYASAGMLTRAALELRQVTEAGRDHDTAQKLLHQLGSPATTNAAQ